MTLIQWLWLLTFNLKVKAFLEEKEAGIIIKEEEVVEVTTMVVIIPIVITIQGDMAILAIIPI